LDDNYDRTESWKNVSCQDLHVSIHPFEINGNAILVHYKFNAFCNDLR
jgi:hypothetical protein